MKKNVAIIWGGYSSESIVSEKSMHGIYSFIDKERYNIYKINISKDNWSADIDNKKYNIDKNDFSIATDKDKIKIDFAYITIHGTPGEDGRLQGYLDMLNIPYSTCGAMASALSFNKFVCNNFLKNFKIRVANSVYLSEETTYDTKKIVEELKLPLFVKPNTGGSSFATTKVKNIEELDNAIKSAFKEAPDVIIESFIKGTEVTCGCYKTADKEVILPLTEVVSHNDFFDYNAKYMGEVEEITPARIPEDISNQIKTLTSRIYDLINAKGLIRADFIISDNIPYLLEVNTTPGMTQTSFIPQQVAVAGLNMTNVLTEIIECEYFRNTK